MKFWLLACVPWMVASALAQSDEPRSAEVAFPHLGVTSAPAWQIGNDCFVSVESLKTWGYSIKKNSMDVSIGYDGRTVIVPFRNQAGQSIVNLGQVLRKFGAEGTWLPGTGTFEVLGVIRSIKVEHSLVMVEATLPANPTVTTMSDPNRIVLDFPGMKLDDRAAIDLPAEARVGQWKPDVVRVVIESNANPETRNIRPSRRFVFNYAIEADPNSEPIPQNPVPAPRSNDTGSIPQPLGVFKADLIGIPSVAKDSDTRTELTINLSDKMMSSAQVKRVSADQLELTLPGVRYSGPEEPKLDSSAIKGMRITQGPAQTTVQIALQRPMGAELSMAGTSLNLALIKPRVGDGKLSSKTIVVDAGHGGKDGGAQAPDRSAQEKHLALAVARKLSAALSAEGATVIMTRNSDVYIPLEERPAIANRTGADFFLSVHINSNSVNNSTSGGITFYHKRDPIGQLLAECVQTEIAKVSKIKSLGVWSDLRIYDTGFSVLRNARVPAVLIELGFINHSSDRARMKTEDFQTQVAQAIVKGLKVYLGNGQP